MPKLVKELTEGVGFSYSSENGQVAASQPRVFRVILNDPNELINIEEACGVRIGDELRPGAKLYCTSFEARYEGSSRLVLICTFQFRVTADAASSGAGAGGGNDPKSQPPDVRPADWSVSASLAEVPVFTWFKTNPDTGAIVPPAVVPKNAAGDRFDAITKYEPIVTISVQHWESNDPTENVERVGVVNDAAFWVGNLFCKPHTLMLRGISSQAAVESWGGQVYRGWNATYEFAYRRNHVKGLWNGFGNPLVDADIGWDIAVPETGFNCLAFVPAGAFPEEDIFGQPLKHENGKIVDPEQMPDGVNVGDRVRAMVKVFEYEDGGTSQAPSAQPIPLNETGTPRKSFGNDAADPPVIINRYLIYDEFDFDQFALRGLR